MIKLSFTIPIEPKAQMRVKACIKGIHASVYKPKEQKQNELRLMELIEKYKPDEPIQGALSIVIKAYLPIPQSKPDWWKKAADEGLIYPITKPDIDNLIKFLLDIIGAMSYFNNDSQIVKITAEKYYSVCPHWEITLQEIWQPSKRKEIEVKGGCSKQE